MIFLFKYHKYLYWISIGRAFSPWSPKANHLLSFLEQRTRCWPPQVSFMPAINIWLALNMAWRPRLWFQFQWKNDIWIVDWGIVYCPTKSYEVNPFLLTPCLGWVPSQPLNRKAELFVVALDDPRLAFDFCGVYKWFPCFLACSRR